MRKLIFILLGLLLAVSLNAQYKTGAFMGIKVAPNLTQIGREGTSDSLIVYNPFRFAQGGKFQSTVTMTTLVQDSLNVDNGTLVVSPTTHRVGIGTTSPQHLLSSYTSSPAWVLTDTDYNLNVSTAAEAVDSAAVKIYTEADGDTRIDLTAKDGGLLSLYDNGSYGYIQSSRNVIAFKNTSNEFYFSGSNFYPNIDDSGVLGISTLRWNGIRVTDNVYVGGKNQTATLYVSQEATIAGVDSSVKIYVSGGDGRLDLLSDVGQKVTFTPETASTATAGAATLPSAPVGFLLIKIDGTTYKVPYYAN